MLRRTAALAAEDGFREPVKLVVDQGKELFGSTLVTVTKAAKQMRDLAGCVGRLHGADSMVQPSQWSAEGRIRLSEE